MRRIVLTAALAAMGLSAASSMGAVVISQNFDGTPPPTSINTYTYQSNGTMTSVNGVDANGVGGTNAAFITVDSTGVLNATGQNYNYWGLGIGNGYGFSQLPATTDLTQYTFSGDTMGTPLTSSTNLSSNWQILFQNKAFQTVLVLNGPKFALTSAWSNTTSTLDTWGIGAEAGTSLAAYTAALAANNVSQAVIQLQYSGGQFALAAGNTVRIDNLIMTAPVPEPATLSLLALAAGGLMIRRRAR